MSTGHTKTMSAEGMCKNNPSHYIPWVSGWMDHIPFLKYPYAMCPDVPLAVLRTIPTPCGRMDYLPILKRLLRHVTGCSTYRSSKDPYAMHRVQANIEGCVLTAGGCKNRCFSHFKS